MQVQNYTFYFEFDTRKRKKVAKSLEYQRIIPIFAASEMANPVFSVWSKTGPTLLRSELYALLSLLGQFRHPQMTSQPQGADAKVRILCETRK